MNSQRIDLTDVIKRTKPELKENSIKIYTTNLSKLYKYVMDTHTDNITTLDFIFNIPKIDDFLKDKALKTKANYYNNILTLYKYLIDIQKIDDPKINKLFIEVEQKKSHYNYEIKQNNLNNIKNKNKQEKNISMATYDKFLETLKKNDHIQDYIIFKLLKLYPYRNEISKFEYILPKKYKSLDDEEKKDRNFMMVDDKKETIYIIRHDYKTFSTYGTILDRFYKKDDPKFYTELKNWMTRNTNEYIFTKDGGMLTSKFKEADLSARLGYISMKYLNMSISTSDIFKIVIANFKGEEMSDYIEFIKKKGKSRGTNVNTIIDHYVYKKKSYLSDDIFE